MTRRKPRSDVKRRGAKREPYDRVLIVCEGGRTEPLYFRELANRHRLSTANVKVVGIGSDPHSLVREAKARRRQESKRGEKYDEVYCVFDHDEHPAFDAASSDAEDNGLKLARSWPCFEFWLFLHFRFSRRPYTREGDRSPCENCIRDLKEHLAEYAKADPGLFGKLYARLEVAKTNAMEAAADASITGEFNPSTEIHQLVDYLQSLSAK